MVAIILSNKSPWLAHVYTCTQTCIHTYGNHSNRTESKWLWRFPLGVSCMWMLSPCHRCGGHAHIYECSWNSTYQVWCHMWNTDIHDTHYLPPCKTQKITFRRFAKQQYLTGCCLFNIQAHLQSDSESFLSVFLLIPLAESRVLYIYLSLKLKQTAWQTGGGCLKGL